MAGRTVDLNCDMGESFGAWRLGADDALLAIVTSVSVACGFHAGDPATIDSVVGRALDRGLGVGAHPSYPDLQGFGRRSMAVAADELESIVLYQTAALAGIVRAHGHELNHVKLHGALYTDAARDDRLARACVRAVRRLDPGLLLFAPAGSAVEQAGAGVGLRVVREAFADRRYIEDGSLRSRDMPDAVITEPADAAAQAVAIALRGRIETVTSPPVAVAADTICVHGDNPAAAAVARAVRDALEAAGVPVQGMRRVGSREA